ncbi:Heat induced stress protein YflT [Pisciglobus halotolerans]|uniref:Heat induced stress protein YflT n=2 Tax=Pisciglobus halotolerans TaxID=745365 RepID=A0A1I3AV75_9LACT|nr:Heat induced stress protein YflT [Pisciglobus halotolerans]
MQMEKVIEGSYATADEAIRAVERLVDSGRYLSADITIITSNDNRMKILEQTAVQVDKVTPGAEKSGWEKFKDLFTSDEDETTLEHYGIEKQKAEKYDPEIREGHYVIILTKSGQTPRSDTETSAYTSEKEANDEMDQTPVSANDGDSRLNNAEVEPVYHDQSRSTTDTDLSRGEYSADKEAEEQADDGAKTTYTTRDPHEASDYEKDQNSRLAAGQETTAYHTEYANPDANVGNEDLSNDDQREEQTVTDQGLDRNTPFGDRRDDTRDIVTPPSGYLNELNQANLRADDLPGEGTTPLDEEMPRHGYVDEKDQSIPADPELRADFPDKPFDKKENE